MTGDIRAIERRGRCLLRLLVCVLVLSGCTSYQKALDRCYALSSCGEYSGALDALETSSLAKSDKNRLLYLMEKGLLLHLGGEYAQSNEVLEEADLLAEQLFTRSVSEETLSFVTNDNLIAYAGADYEDVYINYYKALNYINLGDMEGARVECRRIDEKLNYLADTFGSADTFKESAFLRLFMGLTFEASGDDNNAFIAYRNSLEAYRDTQERYGVKAPDLLWQRLIITARRSGLLEECRTYQEQAEALEIDPPDGRPIVAVIVGYGLAPVKKEVFSLVPTDHGFPVKLALPEFVSRPLPEPGFDVSTDGESWHPFVLVENVDKVARMSLEDKKGRVLAKAIARAVAKQVAARKVEKENGPLAGLAMQVAALITERADLRTWSVLPAQIRLSVLPEDRERSEIFFRNGQTMKTYVALPEDAPVRFVILRIL